MLLRRRLLQKSFVISCFFSIIFLDTLVNAKTFDKSPEETFEIDLNDATQKPKFSFADSEGSRSFLFSTLMIIVSEIGDKTFFIAAIMAMKNSRLLVFSAAFSALALMSVLSAALGHVVPNLIPRTYTNYIASFLFLFFGIKMAFESVQMSDEEAKNELEEVSAELKEKEEIELIEVTEAGGIPEDAAQVTFVEGLINLCQFLFSPIFVQTFILTFLAEWGDRSQIATIALAAAQNVYWVTLGTITGHCFCTGLAVIGGRFMAAKISVKRVTMLGAILFISFSLIYLYESIYDNDS
ncbi:hypothetical protein C2G38_2125923 [Gigaspora rosea]|uniref:GDT1 family protein n=1 Tax=Gigaspora rosea TaxID=44941 RepID=A0A397TZB2_9GLOM|nr:hypothetical protein C2G38_2125923 [Gigaspora rosea]